MRLHIQQAPHRLEEGEKGRITATRICALRNVNVLSMGFQRGMKRWTFRSLLRVVSESDIDHINGEGGVWESGVGGGLSKQDTGAGLSVCGYRAKLINVYLLLIFGWCCPKQALTRKHEEELTPVHLSGQDRSMIDWLIIVMSTSTSFLLHVCP